MYLTGFADEAGAALDTQISVTQKLGWHNIEARNVQVDNFPAGNIHDIPEAAFDRLAAKLDAEGVQINCFGSAIANWGIGVTSSGAVEKRFQERPRRSVALQT